MDKAIWPHEARAMADFQQGNIAMLDTTSLVVFPLDTSLMCKDDLVCVIPYDCKRGESIKPFVQGVYTIERDQ